MRVDLTTVKQEVKDAIVKEYMTRHYYWTVGILSFLVGTFFGILIK